MAAGNYSGLLDKLKLNSNSETQRVWMHRGTQTAAYLLDFLASDGSNLGGHIGQSLCAIPIDELLVVVHQGNGSQALAEAAAEDHLTCDVVGRLDVS